jgi:hypothetical protein
MADLLDPTRGQENAAEIRKLIRKTNEANNPAFKELSEADKERFVNVKYKEEYIGGQTGGFAGTIAIETGSELQGAGMLMLLPGSKSGLKGNVLRSIFTGGVIGAASEAPKTMTLQENTDRMKFTAEERLYGRAAGGLTGAAYMGVSTFFTPYKRVNVNIGTAKTVIKSVEDPKKGIKNLAGEAIEFIGSAPIVGDIGEPFGNLGRQFLEMTTGKKVTPFMSFMPTVTRTDTFNNVVVKDTAAANAKVNTDTASDIVLGNKTPSGGRGIRTNIGSTIPTVIKPDEITGGTRPVDDIPPIAEQIKTDVKVDANTRMNYESRVPIRVINSAGGMPFVPLMGGNDFGGKSSKRERTRFIDEFSMAFSGLARPSQPTYFGKQSSISKTRQIYKPKKGKKQRGGFNYAALFV